MNLMQSCPKSCACCSNALRKGPSPAICTRKSYPLRLSSRDATTSRSQRLIDKREPTPKIRDLPPRGSDKHGNRSKSRLLRTTKIRLGLKRPRVSWAVLAAEELLQM